MLLWFPVVVPNAPCQAIVLTESFLFMFDICSKRFLNNLYGPGKKMKNYNTQIQALAK